MKLIVLGSSSKGNGYALQGESETLLLEAGVNISATKKALDFDLSGVVGCLLTHEHGDHSGHVAKYIDSGIDIFTSAGTMKVLGLSGHRVHILEQKTPRLIGSFKILPFRTVHDCADPLGFLIHHPECGNLLFATDTGYLKYTFSSLNNILIEANYDSRILDEAIQRGRTPAFIRKRILNNHMELGVLLDTLQANDLSKVNNIVLIHLSDGSSDAAMFKQKVQETTGKAVHIAEPGLTIEMNKTPF